MSKFLLGLYVGIAIASMVSVAYAKYESQSNDATPVVGYGKFGNTLVPLKVDANGILQTN